LTDIPGDSTTTASLTVGSTVADSLEVSGDHDWFRITLTAGQPVVVTLNGITLADPYLYIRDSSGNLLHSNDDVVDGVIHDSRVAFSPGYTGTYFLDVGAWNENYTGTYQLSVQPYTPPPLGTNDQIAEQLVSGFWGGDVHHWNVSQGGTITVNISTLTAAEQTLARAALAEWTDIIGVHFQEVSSGGQIAFDHSEGSDGSTAGTDAIWSNGIITSAHVQISSSWVNTYGTSLDSYSFQTYVHEIGHALGLGHSGEYNETASYPYDAMFSNDAWPASVMSYFDQHENTYFNGLGFSLDYAVTPMAADILAMQQLYGLSATTRTGDTVYGYNSNAGGIYNASQYPDVAYTIFDSSGNDTLDFSGSGANQVLNLNPEAFSNVSGQTGNVSIARGVVIENAIGGSGDDTLIGNAANNVLDGRGGTNTVSYAAAAAGVTVNMGISTGQNTVGAGIDTLLNYSVLTGSQFDDALSARSGSDIVVHGGTGNDRIVGAGGGDHLWGDAGNDWFVSLGGNDINGGLGYDTVDYSGMTHGITIKLYAIGQDFGNGTFDQLDLIEQVIGTSYADHLYAYQTADSLVGGGGDDILEGTTNGPTKMAGGAGNDVYEVYYQADQIIESAGQGTDLVEARSNYTLGTDVENLTLLSAVYDPYAGAAVNSNVPSSDFYGTGNDLSNVITGNAGANVLSGQGGADTLTGGAGADTLTGGAGNDIFKDTASGLNGDTITDFGSGDKIVITDANLAGFSFSLSGHTLTYTGGSLTLGGLPTGAIVASIGVGGGIQLTISESVASAGIRATHNDFNGDGRSDILWANDGGLVTDWLARSDGSFAGNSDNFLKQVDPSWHVAGTGDFNGDGRVDLLWLNNGGLVTDWLAGANGGFSGNSGNFLASVGTSAHLAGTGDFNGDGYADILWKNDNGSVTDWLGQANGGFTANPGFGASVDASWHVAGTGDFNGDGYSDILWKNNGGLVTDWLGRADGGFTGNGDAFLAHVDTSWHIAGTGDFNGDGYSDILWQNDGGLVTDWLGRADGSFTGNGDTFLAHVDTSWHVAETGDFNGDGRADILWQNNGGLVTDWLATANGSFTGNGDTFLAHTDTSWHIMPNETFF
jgi:serralysin